MSDHAASNAELDDLAKLLDGLVERPVRTAVVPELEKMRKILTNAVDALGTIGDVVDEQHNQLGNLLSASNTLHGHVEERFAALVWIGVEKGPR